MKKAGWVLTALLTLWAVPLPLHAQESAKRDSKEPTTTLKVQVTFTETEGEKKLVNLPYMFFLKVADTASPPFAWTKVRIGSRVPAYVGKDGGLQYIDVGTNIDARGFATDDGRFDIHFDLERSWVEGEVLVPAQKPSNASDESSVGHFKEPIIRQFRTELPFTLRDGQTIQTTQAADPLSGRVLTITVTVNVVK